MLTKVNKVVPRGAEGDSEAELRRFGEELRAARQAAGLTQAQVGERAAVTYRTVSYAEQGQRNLRWSVMHALARALGCRLKLGVRVGGHDDAQQVLRRFGEELRVTLFALFEGFYGITWKF